MQGLALAIFDLDGTLVETAPEISDAVNDTLRHFDWPAVDEALVANWIGHGTVALLVHAVARATGATTESVEAKGVIEAVRAAYDGCYAARCGSRSRLYPGARETLAALRRADVRVALVTNKEGRYTRRVLETHGLTEAFDRVVAGDTLPTKKPDPAGVLSCLETFGAAPERSLFIGDSSIDAATARNAGVPVWLLPHGYNMGEPVDRVDADRILPDFDTFLREWHAPNRSNPGVPSAPRAAR
jgi:phosphoglycolate phosphatase